MGFGLDNLGVINQRNAPAIWVSAFADFPTNGVLGRILVANDTATTYLDLVNGTPNQRAVLGQGLLGDGSGTTVVQTGGDYVVDLGGSLTTNTNIPMNGNTLNFQGTGVETVINADGTVSFTGIPGTVFSASDIGAGVVVPNTRVTFTDPLTGIGYIIAAEQ